MARDIDVVLEDTLEAISLIEESVASHDRASFDKARFVQLGVERSLEIISEATRHLPDELLASIPRSSGASSVTIFRHFGAQSRLCC